MRLTIQYVSVSLLILALLVSLYAGRVTDYALLMDSIVIGLPASIALFLTTSTRFHI